MGGFAWVTLATNDSYSLGALVLAHSLRQVGTTHQLAVLVTPGVTGVMREKLAAVFNVVKEVNILDSRDEANLRLLQRPELGITFTKLHCWRLTQYDKCVFLDADTMVLANADELFEREEFSAAPDVGWPDCFNSGVFVYRPSEETYGKLIQFALDKGSFDGGDQGLLNLYFSDWAYKDISKHLPFIYNMCSTACYSYLPAFKQFGGNVKIIHFIGNAKPWLQYFDTETRQVQVTHDLQHLSGIVQHWWNIFCSFIHSSLSPEMSEVNENLIRTRITADQWTQHFTDLSYNINNDNMTQIPRTNNENDVRVEKDEILKATKGLRGRKAPGNDGIANELLKFGGETLTDELLTLTKIIIKEQKIPNEMKTSLTVPIHKKGSKHDPANYRGITLLSSVLKLITKVILYKLNESITNHEEQLGFRTNRSTTDAIFVIRQLSEKAIEFDTPVFMCFIDFSKAFDRVRLGDVLEALSDRNVPQKLINLIHDIYSNTKTCIKTNDLKTSEIPVNVGVRQGDSLSPMLFNVIMDKVIDSVKNKKGYKMGEKQIKIICYADDVILTANNEDDLQRMLHLLVTTSRTLNMEVSKEKTKCLTISRKSLRCKLEIEGTIIQQVMEFKYLGINISSTRDIYKEVKHQTNKGAVISGCLRDVIWRNKYISIENKTKIYKGAVRPILTYAAETRADTTRTRQQLETTEMRTLRTISGKTLRDRVPSREIRQRCNIQNIRKFIKSRRKEWNAHVDRMDPDRLPKITRDNTPHGKRRVGRPPKRWKQSWVSTSVETP